MSKSNLLELDVLTYALRGAWASPLYFACHTADPGEAGTQSTNAPTYPGYDREIRPADATIFTIVSGTATLAVNVDFPQAPTDALGTITHWSVGNAAGEIGYSGACDPPIVLGTNAIVPRIKLGSTITED